ncbi:MULTISPECIES: hypothetical protein [unclassified Methylobacterium]|uniref:hypothetical protein n=1 Tax=unclassified Methylobacterium TaxID=2615210 RepID=UPI001FEDC09B|nr:MULTISPECIES: hypothetical protein [unclassified Methylobacterium]
MKTAGIKRAPRPMRVCLGLAASLASVLAADAAEPLTVERLSADGWEIAGYTGTFDNRSSLILFRRKDTRYLVQCSILYDVTRNPRVITNCYELH